MIFDHLVLVVKDLASASRHFDSLGFTVRPGGEHPDWGTHNALIGLQDGSYLELLAATRAWQATFYRLAGRAGALPLALAGKSLFHARFVGHLAAGAGLADFALLSDDLERDLQAARSRGLDLAGPFEGSRRRVDGQQVAWRSAMPGSADLPFLIEDLTPRELRVPSGVDCRHPNGVSGAAALAVACRDLERSVDRYRRLLGLEPEEIEAGSAVAVRSACFSLEGMDLILYPADHKMAMRKRSAAMQSISLRVSTGSDPLFLRFSPAKGYHMEPAPHLTKKD